MPIVVTEPAPDSPFGFGHLFSVSTSTVGPFIPPVDWNISILDLDQVVFAGTHQYPTSDPHQPTQNTFTPTVQPVVPLQNAFQQGANALLHVQLISNAAIAEQVTVPIKFDTQGWIYHQIGGAATVDLTPVLDDTNALQVDTAQLLANWTQYTQITLPSLNDVLSIIDEAVHTTLDFAPAPIRLALGEIFNITNPSFWSDRDLSGGTTCERVDYDASFNALFGVTVVVDVVPDDWVFQTPDHAWGFHDLAVLTFTRGGQVTERHGIHNRSHSVSPLPDFPFPWQSTIPIALQPGDTHITVDWAPGVCGRLIGHVLP